MIYTGIGSRKTPDNVLTVMSDIALYLVEKDYTLRSGGAKGADSAFGQFACKKEIYLPWDGFQGHKADGISYIVPEYNESIVFKYHPKPSRLTESGFKLMSRNANQVLGRNTKNPILSEFIIAWTADGGFSGGTGFALRLAYANNIPILNLYDKNILLNWKKFVNIEIYGDKC